MLPVELYNRNGNAPFVFTCEHAAYTVPPEYDDLGLSAEQLQEHIGWDIGAGALTRLLADCCDAPGVLSVVSRLVIDCNRSLADADLILAESCGVTIPGNRGIDDRERERRTERFYLPFHDAVDRVLKSRPGAPLLSVHSFTPELNGQERRFDVGVLFDTWTEDARIFGQALAESGLTVRYNEPYSGLDGLIYSARAHGMEHRRRYLELEVNNRLLRDRDGIERIADAVVMASTLWLEGLCD